MESPCGFQLLDVDPNDQEEDGANIDLDSQRKGKCAVIKTSTRQVRRSCTGGVLRGTLSSYGRVLLLLLFTDLFLQTYFLPVIGLVDAEKLKPGDLVVSDAVVAVRYDAGRKTLYALPFRKETNLSGFLQDHVCIVLIKR